MTKKNVVECTFLLYWQFSAISPGIVKEMKLRLSHNASIQESIAHIREFEVSVNLSCRQNCLHMVI